MHYGYKASMLVRYSSRAGPTISIVGLMQPVGSNLLQADKDMYQIPERLSIVHKVVHVGSACIIAGNIMAQEYTQDNAKTRYQQ